MTKPHLFAPLRRAGKIGENQQSTIASNRHKRRCEAFSRQASRAKSLSFSATVNIKDQFAATEQAMKDPISSEKMKFAQQMTRATFRTNYWTHEMAAVVADANAKRPPHVDQEV